MRCKREMGQRLRGIVLDLRGDPGGLLDQAVSLADVFIAKGPIVATVGRHPASRQYFEASGDSVAPQVPIVVLINGGSASASEIVAAALQDAGRAVVVGTASYGKGTVQTVLRLPNDGELTLTWAQLVAPAGYLLHEHGVVPTLCTSDLGNDDQSVQIALAARERLVGGRHRSPRSRAPRSTSAAGPAAPLLPAARRRPGNRPCSRRASAGRPGPLQPGGARHRRDPEPCGAACRYGAGRGRARLDRGRRIAIFGLTQSLNRGSLVPWPRPAPS